MDAEEIKQNNQKIALRILISFAVVAVLALSIFGVVKLIESLKSASLLIYVAPSDATISIDGQEYTNGVYRFYPGTITAEIRRDGFEPKTQTLELQNGRVTELFTYLTEEGGNFNWYVSHDEDLSILRQISSDDASLLFLEDYDQKLAKAEQIKNAPDLPYTAQDSDGNIISVVYAERGNYCPYSSVKPCVIITKKIGDASYNLGLDLLREHGYDPDYFNIIYQ